jgi:hypothetical protein
MSIENDFDRRDKVRANIKIRVRMRVFNLKFFI